MQNAYVYGLRFLVDGHAHCGRIRYVGKAFNPQLRLRRHLNPKEMHGRLARSIRKHGGAAFSLEILETVSAPTRAEADKLAGLAEVRLIAQYQTATGEHGLNLTMGGDGFRLTGEALERQRERSRRHLREVLSRPEVREKLTDGTRKRYQDPAFLQRHRDWMKVRNKVPGYQERLRAGLERLHNNPVHMAKIARHMSSLWTDPEFRRAAAERGAISARDPGSRRKRSLAMRRHYEEQPNKRAAKVDEARALHRDPEFAQKYADGLRKKHADPAYAAKHADQTRQRHANPAFTRSAKMGIALHWAQKHEADGKQAAAETQRATLAQLLAECDPADVSRIKMLAEQYLRKGARA